MKILFYDTKSYDKESFEKRREEYPEIEIHYLKSELNEEYKEIMKKISDFYAKMVEKNDFCQYNKLI